MADKAFVNEAILRILTTLYEAFPKPIDLNPKTLDPDAGAEEREIYYELIIWLRDEGFIRCGSPTLSGVFRRAVLTLKGFAVLNAIPEALGERKSFGDYFKELLKEGSVNAINQAVSLFLSYLINK
ncbi:hypothetical protein Theam_0036 [Thermovibrio ammonificans HB-1]|uniref:Uncharacterized protein n=1 Tax=Thermovibrio ammonificans (strain DSM 15698 / JCM 12110 / HB-1) TaxID=648996 RepID=E8T2T5_THEA1|nr:hypothetical protein [Thermovibrio ammonificans]ADU96010.1 hypothetical protein Theam_0036 [Thermovibrio ammonificans HB-1]